MVWSLHGIWYVKSYGMSHSMEYNMACHLMCYIIWYVVQHSGLLAINNYYYCYYKLYNRQVNIANWTVIALIKLSLTSLLVASSGKDLDAQCI